MARRFEGRVLTAPAWSPDGSTIALTERRTGNVGRPVRTVLLLSPDGGIVRELECPLPGGAISNVTWSGDSQSVIYEVPDSTAETGGVISSPVGSAGRVLLQNVRTGKARTLFAVQSPVGRLQVAAPGRIIFDTVLQRGSLREIQIDSTLGAAPHWLARGSSIDRQPYYSPDGHSVVFSSSRSGDVDLWEVSTETNTLRRLTDNPASDWDPFVTSDGKHLLWSSNRSGTFEIWMADRDGGSPRQVSHDGGDAENPAATSDGWVFYTSAQTAHPGLWKIRADGSQARLLVPGNISWPDVSPDGQYVLYHTLRLPSGTDDLRNSGEFLAESTMHVVRVEDGKPAEFEAPGRRGRFTADGRSIVYIDTKTHDIVRRAFPWPPGTPVEVLVPASSDLVPHTFDISPDSRRLVVSYEQTTRTLVVADGVRGIR